MPAQDQVWKPKIYMIKKTIDDKPPLIVWQTDHWPNRN